MAVKVTTAGGGDAKDVLARYQKKLGDKIGSFGGDYADVDRIPTGLFPFDLATGGGFPRSRVSIVYGPESSNKTNMALLAIANNQKLRPDQINVYVAIEPFDKAWAQKLGVDTEKLIVLMPDYAEQVVDMTADFLAAEDCGVVVLDSLAAMITTAEAEKSAESANPGGQGLVIGKLVRKTTLALNQAIKAGRQPSLIYINQTRYKIGVMMGDPETMPGGNAPKFQANLWVRVYGKNVKDSKISDTFPVRKDVKFVIKKNKVPIVATGGEYEMVTYPYGGLHIGDTDDITTIIEYLRSFEAFEKAPKGWLILGELYPTQEAFKTRVYEDRAFGAELRNTIIERVLQDKEGEMIIQNSPSIDADGVVTEGADG